MNRTSILSIAHLLIAMIATLTGVAAAPSKSPDAAFEFGPRPARPVFDPTATLPPKDAAAISNELNTLREREGIDMIVVVLKTLDGAPAELVAGRFADAWCSPAFNCVILHVPGDKAGPWIVPGGSDIRKVPGESVRLELAQTSHQASLEPDDVRKIRVATTHAAEMLRVWFGQGTYLALQRLELRKQAYEKMAQRARLKKVLLPLAAGGTALLFLLAYLTARWFINRRPRSFTGSSRQIRLGAPRAGGNSAAIHLSRLPSRQ